jgi:hypothetical protein
LIEKHAKLETSHKSVCRLLEHIQKQHSIAKKLMVQLRQESMVLDERVKVFNLVLSLSPLSLSLFLFIFDDYIICYIAF